MTQSDDAAQAGKKVKKRNDDAVQALQEELKSMKDLAARAQADLQNARIRMEKEASDIRQFAAESIILKLLPTIDNFSRAFEHLPEELKDHEWIKGILTTEQELLKQLAENGLQRMESLGKPVNPDQHEVLLMGPGEVDTVIEVFEEGYMLHDKVIRVAKVKVGER